MELVETPTAGYSIIKALAADIRYFSIIFREGRG
jgi:hypothetical protein